MIQRNAPIGWAWITVAIFLALAYACALATP
jgi:hypothetical protein